MPLSEITLAHPQPSALAVSVAHPPIRPSTFLFALTTSLLLWLCYFPVDCGWLIWVALVPLLTLVRSSARPSRVYLSAWIGGLVFHLTAIQWMRVADPRMYFTWIVLSFYCSLYFPLAVWLMRLLDRRSRWPLILTVPIVWTALEFLRSTFAGGFAWYLLGHSQHTFLPLIQIADVTGAYGVSFLIAAVNALLFEILRRAGGVSPLILAGTKNQGANAPRSPTSSRIGLLVQGLAILIALIGTSIYGFWRLGQDRQRPGPRIALIQGNLDQRLRNDSAVSDDAAKRMGDHFRDLADLAAIYRPDLIVWPETSWPYEWREDENGPTPHCREMAEDMAARWHSNLLVGMNGGRVGADGHKRRYNSAILLDHGGKFAGRYDKIHRVPFGEYVPFREWLPWMNYFAPYDFDYSVWPGEQHTRMPLIDSATGQKSTFGVLICYEDTDAEVARPYGGGDAITPVDFVLNISNDGWFDGTSEHDQHLAICRFRAIECRRAVARSVNMGISAVIDSNGRVLQPRELPRPHAQVHDDFHVWNVPMQRGGTAELPVSQWRDYKQVAGVLLATVPLDDRVSLYARWGDWLPWSCWLFLAGALVLAWVRRAEDKP